MPIEYKDISITFFFFLEIAYLLVATNNEKATAIPILYLLVHYYLMRTLGYNQEEYDNEAI